MLTITPHWRLKVSVFFIACFVAFGCKKDDEDDEDDEDETTGSVTSGGTVETTTDCPSYSAPDRTQSSLAVDPTNDQIVYVGVESKGFFKTTDGGATWSRIVNGIKANPTTGSGAPCYNEFYSTVVSAVDPKRVCFAQNGGPGTINDYVARYNGVYCSRDGGTTWEQLVSPTMNTAIYPVAFHPENPDIIYAGANGNGSDHDSSVYYNSVGIVYKSSDAGATWRELATGWEPGLRAHTIRVAPDAPDTIYVSTFLLASQGGGGAGFQAAQYGLLKSTDAGETWTRSTKGMATASVAQQTLTLFDMAPGQSSKLFLTTLSDDKPYAYISDDAGQTFTSASSQDIDVFSFDPQKDMHLVGLSIFQSGVFQSSDGGETWSLLGDAPSDMPNNPVRVSDLEWSHQDSSVVYMSGTHGTVYKSEDGGAHWTKVLSSETLPP